MKKIITYGTFDLFHRGHYNILKRAKDLGDYLIVGVTGENYDAERGKLSVKDSLATRIQNVRNTGFADEIIVEEYDGQKINDIIKYEADVLVLGLDWKGKFDHLKKYCDVVYLERTKDISSTQLRAENHKIFNYGIVTDDFLSESFIFDAEYVSGIHIESVYSKNQVISSLLCQNAHIDGMYTDYDAFLDSVDIITVNCKLEDRYDFVKTALEKGKYVVCESPMSLDPNKVRELFDLAKSHQVVLLDNIPTVYVRTFHQLLSIVRGATIGDIIKVKCTLPLEELNFVHKRDQYDALYYIICVLMKILGEDYNNFTYKVVKNKGVNVYVKLEFEYENALASGELTQNIHDESYLEIFGTKGKIQIPVEWWKASYFKTKLYKEDYVRRYSTNFEGNGFKYLIQVMLQMINEGQYESQRLSSSDSIKIVEILNCLNKEL